MNLALVRKTVYDDRWAMMALMGGVMLFAVIILNAFASIPWEMFESVLQVRWIAGIIRAMTGAELSQSLSMTTMSSFAFAHPVVLSLTWCFLVMSSTRVLSGEIDRGTADMLLSLPLSRWSVYLSVSVWIFIACPMLVGSLWLGVLIGSRIADLPQPVVVWELRGVAVNACCMLWAVAGISLLFSACGSRRSRSVAWIFAILVGSFMLNSLAAFWPRIESVAYVSLLRYFRPFVVVRDGLNPFDVGVLLLVSLFTWLLGAVIWSRRDVPAA